MHVTREIEGRPHRQFRPTHYGDVEAMKPAQDPNVDYRALVKRGYDACSAEFNATRSHESGDVLLPLIERLTPGARVLDLGCGTGVPIARTLARTCAVTGVDLSTAQVALARRQVPEATFVASDMATCEFRAGSFDAVVSFYAIFHLPREEHEALFGRIHRWLKPGGYLMASLAFPNEEAYTEEFFGVEMYWSNYSIGEYEAMLTRRGFELIGRDDLPHGYDGDEHKPESHPLVLAQKAPSA